MLLRLIGKWLNAGVLEEGRVYRPDAGTPQGGVISPLLANIYLNPLDHLMQQEGIEMVEALGPDAPAQVHPRPFHHRLRRHDLRDCA